MALYSISITKRVSFRGVQQEFSNVYTYKNIVVPDSASLSAQIDAIVVEEKKLHSADVTWVRANVWSTGGTNQQNQMVYEKNLSGVGSGSTDTNVDRERAYLVQFPAVLTLEDARCT